MKRKKVANALAWSFLAALLGVAASVAYAEAPLIVGTWIGTSTCVDRQLAPACNDEKVKLVFSAGRQEGEVHLDAQKRVNDAYQTMFEIDLMRDPDSGEWTHAFESPGGLRADWSFRDAVVSLSGRLVERASGSVLREVAAQRAQTPLPAPETLDAFGRAAASALASVGKFDEITALSAWTQGSKSPFMFPAREGSGGFERITCERTQAFRIHANANEQAQILVGACSADAKRVTSGIANQEAWSRRLLQVLPVTPEGREQYAAVMKPLERSLAGGATGTAFTSMIVGHGVMFMHTAVVNDPKRGVAYVVQADTMKLCGESAGIGVKPGPSPLCRDTKSALLDVAVELARLSP